MGMNDSWRIKYEGKRTEDFHSLMRLLTFPKWFSFSNSHDDCISRLEDLHWRTAEYELTEILSNLDSGDKITVYVEHDVGKNTMALTKGENGSINVEYDNDGTEAFKETGFKICEAFDAPGDSYTYNLDEFLDRAAGLVDENEGFLRLADKYVRKFVKFTPPIKTMEDMKAFLKNRKYSSQLINEEDLFYDYYYIHSMYQAICDMPLTILDRLGGVLEFNEEYRKRSNSEAFIEAVEKIKRGIPGDNGVHGELTTRIRNSQDNYADLPAWVKVLPLKLLYEMGGPHKIYRYVEKYGKEKLMNELNDKEYLLCYMYLYFIDYAEDCAKSLERLIPLENVFTLAQPDQQDLNGANKSSDCPEDNSSERLEKGTRRKILILCRDVICLQLYDGRKFHITVSYLSIQIPKIISEIITPREIKEQLNLANYAIVRNEKDFYSSMDVVTKDLREYSDSFVACILSINNETKTFEIISESMRERDKLEYTVKEIFSKIPYRIVASWEKALSETNSIIIKNRDMLLIGGW